MSSSDNAFSRETSWMDDVESRRVKKWRFSEARLHYQLIVSRPPPSLPLRGQPSSQDHLRALLARGDFLDLMCLLRPWT
jgi:hypothetical protein